MNHAFLPLRRAAQSEICAAAGKECAPTPNPCSWGFLTFGELEPLAGALLTVLLPLVCARVASEEAEFLQTRTQFGVELHQSSCNTKTGSARLAGHAAAIRQNEEIELFHGFGSRERLPHHGARTFRRKIILEGAAIDLNLALTRAQKYARHRAFSAACS